MNRDILDDFYEEIIKSYVKSSVVTSITEENIIRLFDEQINKNELTQSRYNINNAIDSFVIEIKNKIQKEHEDFFVNTSNNGMMSLIDKEIINSKQQKIINIAIQESIKETLGFVKKIIEERFIDYELEHIVSNMDNMR
jgi:uncharacterized membrane protein YheB (UPF0754 family)